MKKIIGRKQLEGLCGEESAGTILKRERMPRPKVV
jgi:hypothetical protein